MQASTAVGRRVQSRSLLDALVNGLLIWRIQTKNLLHYFYDVIVTPRKLQEIRLVTTEIKQKQ